MKKYLIIAIAICILFLSACGSRVETSTPATHSTTHATGSITTASPQRDCQGLYDQQAQLSQQYQAASVQFSATKAHGNLQQVREVENRLISLRQSIVQVQAHLKLCYKNVD
jgi:protein involved in sex pheromone biosynthesis